MRKQRGLDGLRVLLAIAYRASPLRAVLAFTPFFPITAAVGVLATRSLLNTLRHRDNTAIVVAVVVFTVAWGVAAIAGRAGNSARLQVGEAMTYELDRRLIDATSAISSLEPFERPELLDALEVIRSQRETLVQFPRTGGWFVDGVGGMVVSVVLLVIVAPQLAFVILAGVPTVLLGRWAQKHIDTAVHQDAPRSRIALHYFDVATAPASGKEIRIFGLRDELLNRFSDQWRTSERIRFRAEATATLARSAGALVAVAVFLFGLNVVAEGARRGTIGPGDVFVVLAMITQVVGQLGSVANGVGQVRRSIDIARRVAGIIDLANADGSAQSSRTSQVPARLGDGIRLRNLRFQYPDTSSPAIDGMDVHLPAGAVIALVGDNGAGKSTLLKLLFGFYEPDEGAILIDGVPLHTMKAAEWRARTSACFQDHAQFHYLAREVVGVGALDHIDNVDTITGAVGRAQATDVIDRLPEGLESQLGSTFQGHELSGGQWQKLSIARALLPESPLLLALDEPTSALDPLAEHELFERYAHEARTIGAATGAITVLVSHRFSTVRIADLILVISDGRVSEVGTHEELIAAGGTYAELYDLQARHYR
jgi:ATP-binding cassette subfamily B protein